MGANRMGAGMVWPNSSTDVIWSVNVSSDDYNKQRTSEVASIGVNEHTRDDAPPIKGFPGEIDGMLRLHSLREGHQIHLFARSVQPNPALEFA